MGYGWNPEFGSYKGFQMYIRVQYIKHLIMECNTVWRIMLSVITVEGINYDALFMEYIVEYIMSWKSFT